MIANDQDISFEDAVNVIDNSADFRAALHQDGDDDDSEIDQIHGFIFGHSAKFWSERSRNKYCAFLLVMYVD